MSDTRSTASPPDDDPLGSVVESFLDRFRRGERPAVTDLISRHPDLAGPIRELIPALVELEQLGGSTGSLGSPVHFADERGTGHAGRLPERLGDYIILRQVGGGGMGVVYEAERESLKSRVALKVMHPRFRADPKYLRRFHAEARLAAGLHHTNIVSVFDYGEQEGVCYYAMQFIDGQPLDAILADIHRLRDDGTRATGALGLGGITTPLSDALSLAMSGAIKGLLTGRYDVPTGPVAVETLADAAVAAALAPTAPIATDEASSPRMAGSHVAEPAEAPSLGGEPSSLGASSLGFSSEVRYFREIARITALVADALEYAHRRGVLHRDIKPSNLLLDALGNVWVTDFGLAKLEEGADLSQSRDLVGTLRYMAPERFRGKSDRRGDIYSLGATLYELLTLRPPFEETDQIRLIERIRNDAPTPPRQLARAIPRDLETIVLKALAKDAKDRFGSAGELADELRRFVDGRPIRSRPVSLPERFWRWCKRDPWLAAASIAAAVLTTALAVGGTWTALVYRDQVGRISHQNNQILAQINQISAQNDHIRTDYIRIQQAESATQKSLFKVLVTQARATRLSRREGQRFGALAALEQAAGIARGLTLPASELELLRDEVIACLALPDLKPIGQVTKLPPNVLLIAVDGTFTRYALRFRNGTISVRRIGDDREIGRFQARGDRETWVFALSPDGRYLATTHYPGWALTVWDVDRGSICLNEPGPVAGGSAARFSPDSRRLALVNEESRELRVYDLATSRHRRIWSGIARTLAFRPDGKRIAVVDNDSGPPTCRILDAESGEPVREVPLRVRADDVAWSPDGTMLATTSAHPDSRIDLWDTATGIRRATLEGADNSGLKAAFHPAGTVLASNGYEARLRLWDPIQGRPLLSVTAGSHSHFSPDGRIVLQLEDRLATYQVEPALEYRTFAHASSQPLNYARASVHPDGRILAVGTDHGIGLWDMARGTELGFLSIGNAWHVMFAPSGDLITGGDIGVQRWPVRLDAGRGEFGIGPPHRLPLPVTRGGIDQDRSGRIVAVAARAYAYVATPDGVSHFGPLPDCRGVAVSPDGQWLATGNHWAGGAQVWRISDGAKVADLPIDHGTGVVFSPDGKWLVTVEPPRRLWHVGTWQEVKPSREVGFAFSPDGRIMVTVDPSRIVRLIEFSTGRTLAHLECPDLPGVAWPAFSPDGARLVLTSNDRPAPAAHVWDLRAIRKHLVRMGLDWDAPAFSDDDPADPALPPLPPLQVDHGSLEGHLQHYTENAEALRARYSARLERDPRDVEAYHHRAHSLALLNRLPDAIADLDQAIRLRPGDAHLRDIRGRLHEGLKQHEAAIADFEAALALKADLPVARQNLALAANNLAWGLARSPADASNLPRALELARRALALAPARGDYLNTMGVVLYRSGRYDDAIATLERSLKASRGQTDAFDLFVMAMALERQGHPDRARECYDRAMAWMRQPHFLEEQSVRDLRAFRAEAEDVLGLPATELPEDVFAP